MYNLLNYLINWSNGFKYFDRLIFNYITKLIDKNLGWMIKDMGLKSTMKKKATLNCNRYFPSN